jgi:hypothetical protein
VTWGDYLSYKARADAAERRAVELEKALREIQMLCEVSGVDSLTWRIVKKALSGEPPE